MTKYIDKKQYSSTTFSNKTPEQVVNFFDVKRPRVFIAIVRVRWVNGGLQFNA